VEDAAGEGDGSAVTYEVQRPAYEGDLPEELAVQTGSEVLVRGGRERGQPTARRAAHDGIEVGHRREGGLDRGRVGHVHCHRSVPGRAYDLVTTRVQGGGDRGPDGAGRTDYEDLHA